MVEGLIHRRNNLYRAFQIKEFPPEIFFAGLLKVRVTELAEDRKGCGISENLNLMCLQFLLHRREQLIGQGAVHQNGIQGIAHRWTLNLGIYHNSRGLRDVSAGSNIGMANARSGLYGWHQGISAHKLNQRIRSARDQNIYVARGGEQFLNMFPWSWQKGDRSRRQTELVQNLLNNAYDCRIGVQCLLTPFQHTGVS